MGGPGNATGLERLGVAGGMRGCVRGLRVNEREYGFGPGGGALKGYGVGEFPFLFRGFFLPVLICVFLFVVFFLYFSDYFSLFFLCCNVFAW